MLYLTSFYCLLHTHEVQLFDDNEHRPIFGSCKHTICLKCFQSLKSSSCPLCQKENAFDQANPNYTAIELINKCREDFWSTMKRWWSGENYGEGLCSKCAQIKTLRICLTCHGSELCESDGGESKLWMRSEKDLVNLARHVICADCYLDKHEEGHTIVKIDSVKYSKRAIRMVTARIILKLFEDGWKKKERFIDCKLRIRLVEVAAYRLRVLLGRFQYKNEDECGYLGEQIKLELTKKYIDDIDKNLNELFIKDQKENPVCECAQLDDKIKKLGNGKNLTNLINWPRLSTIETSTPGCPLHSKSHLEERLKLYNMIGQTPPERVTPEPFNDNQCPTCVFIDYNRHQKIPENNYVQNWLVVIETFWKSEMPPLENYCTRCLEHFDEERIGASCELSINKEKIDEEKIKEMHRDHYEKGGTHYFIHFYAPNTYCLYSNCLMKDQFFWKYKIINGVVGDIKRMMDNGIRNTVWNCHLRKVRMEQLTKNLHHSICNLDLREHDRKTFREKVAEVNTSLENLKTQWNTFQISPQDEPKCKCTVIWENNKRRLEENRFGDFDARQERDDLRRKMGESQWKFKKVLEMIERVIEKKRLEEERLSLISRYALEKHKDLGKKMMPIAKKRKEEKKRMMLKKTIREKCGARKKYYGLEKMMEEMANYSLEQDISGCPMEFDHGLVLDASIVEELEEKCSWVKFVETFEKMDTNCETPESFD